MNIFNPMPIRSRFALPLLLLVAVEFGLGAHLMAAPAGAPREQTTPAIAASSNLFLVAWSDRRMDDVWDIYAARVRPDGTLLDAEGIPVAQVIGVQQFGPAVASDGRNFLVAWVDYRGGYVGDRPTGPDIYMARISAEGQVLDPGGIRVYTAVQEQFNPAVAFNGTQYLIAWADIRDPVVTGQFDITAARVTTGGVVLDPQGIIVSTNVGNQFGTGVAASGGDFFVTWHEQTPGAGGIYGTRVTAAGQVIHPGGLRLAGTRSDNHVRVSATRSGFFVAWGDEYAGWDEMDNLYAQRLSPAGEITTGGYWTLCGAAGYQGWPAIAALGDEIMAVWMDARLGFNKFQLRGARILAGQTSSVDGFLISDQLAPGWTSAPAIASLSDQYLVVWGSPAAVNGSEDIYAARLSRTGEVLDTVPLLISRGECSFPQIATQPRNLARFVGQTAKFSIEATATCHLDYQWQKDGVSLSDNGRISGTHTATLIISSLEIADAGTYSVIASNTTGHVVSQPATLTILQCSQLKPAGLDQMKSAVASDGKNSFIVWEDRRNRETAWTDSDIYGARVTADGQVLDLEGIPISRNQSWQVEPAVASDGTNYLVVWSDDRDEGVALYGNRVTADGEVLDGDGFRIFLEGGAQFSASVAFNGTDYLVLNTEYTDEGGYTDLIRAARVTPSGIVRDPGGIIIHRANTIFFPSIASLDQNWLVVWTEWGNRVAGAVINRHGIVSPAQTLGIDPIAFNDSRTGVAALGTNYLVTWVGYKSIQNGGYSEEIKGTLVDRQGAPLRTVTVFAYTNTTLSGTGTVHLKAGFPAVAAGPSDFLVTWTSDFIYSNGWDHMWLANLHGARVSPHGSVSPSFPICTVVQEQSHPRTAFDGEQFLVVWDDFRTAPPTDYVSSYDGYGDVYAARVTLQNSVRDPLGILVSSQCANAPAITKQPESLVKFTGATATFSVEAVGLPPLAFQWQKDGIDLPADPRITGSDAATLSIVGLVPEDCGNYRVIVSNAAGFVVSDSVILEVKPLPRGAGAVDISFSAFLNWSGPDVDKGPTVYDMAKQPDGRIIIAGFFDSVSGVQRNHIARLLPDGRLDSSFEATSIGQLDGISRIALQPDGKVVIMGHFDSMTGSPVGRLNSDGTWDLTFAPDLNSHATYLTDVAVQSDGKILLSGTISFTQLSSLRSLARLNGDGSVDTSFPGVLPSTQNSIYAMGLQPDGKIVGLAAPLHYGGTAGLIARFLTDSSFDPSFDGQLFGYAARAIAFLPDGKMVVAGEIDLAENSNGSYACSNVVRLHSDGSFDSSFVRPSLCWLGANTIALQPDGKLLVGCEHGGVSRLLPDGALDEDFLQGEITPEFGGTSGIMSIVQQDDGHILVGGAFSEYNGVPALGLVRLFSINPPEITQEPTSQTRLVGQKVIFTVSATGSLPLQYQWWFNGSALPGQTNASLHLTRIASAHAGSYSVMVSNSAGIAISDSATLQVLPVRFEPGAIDPGFSAELALGSTVRGIARQPDGKLIVVGWFTAINGFAPHHIMRLNPDGSRDSTFVANFGPYPELFSVAVQRDGKILVAGSFEEVNDTPQYGIVRLLPDGSLDPEFLYGGGPEVIWGAFRSFVIQPDGKIIVGGLGEYGEHSVLMRLHPNGAIDESFNAGEVIIWEGDGYVVFNLALQTDGKILVHGEISQVQGKEVGGFFRLNPDGSLDQSFRPAWQTGEEDVYANVTSLLLEPDGRILLAGSSTLPDGSNPSLFRINPDGSIDASFVADLPTFGDCFAMARQADGKTVLGAQFYEDPIGSPLRLRVDGKQDTTFDVGTGVEGTILRILIEPEGRGIFLAGAFGLYDGLPVSGVVKIQRGPLEPAVTIRPAPWDQKEPAIAANGNLYLVVWTDARNRDTDYDIFGARVTPGGQVLDPNGIAISTAPGRQEMPAVASDGQGFFVVWQDSRAGVTSTGTDVYGARVAADGAVLEPDGISISRAASSQFYPRIAFNGTNFFVTWYDYRTGRWPDIYGARVEATGRVLDPAGLGLATSSEAQWSPGVAAWQGEFLVAWHDSTQGMMGTRVTDAGQVLNPGGILFSAHDSPGQTHVAANDSGYLVVWGDVRDYESTRGDIYGRRVAASGQPIGATDLPICVAPEPQTRPAIAAAAQDFLVVWNDSRLGSQQPTIYGGVVTSSGSAHPQGFLIGASNIMSYGAPAVGSLNGEYLVSWAVMEGAGAYYTDLVMARVSAAGTLIDTTPKLVGTVEALVPIITWAPPADIVYGQPLGAAQLNATANVPGSFVYQPPAGSILQAGGGRQLTVTFTPQDQRVYTTAQAITTINVRRAPLTITADNKFKVQGQTNPELTATYTGLVAGDGPTSLDTPASLLTEADENSAPGTYPIVIGGAQDGNYEITHVPGVLSVMARPTNAGAVDLSFMPLLEDWPVVSALAAQPDGKLLVAGMFNHVNGQSRMNLVRLLPNGALDPAFAPLTWEPCCDVRCLTLQPDGRVLVGGHISKVNGIETAGLIRLNADGSVDSTFSMAQGSGGVVTALALQPDGKILVGGRYFVLGAQSRTNFMRLHSNGSIDVTFHPGELRLEEDDDFTALAVQPDGKVLIGGELWSINGEQLGGLLRFNPDGSLDRSFLPAISTLVQSIQLLPNGRIMLAGRLFDSVAYTESLSARLNNDGSLDTSYHRSPSDSRVVYAMAVQGDGKAVLGGQDIGAGRGFVVRLLPEGTPDATFDTGSGPNLQVNTVALQPEGSIMVGGWFTQYDSVPRSGLVKLFNDSTAAGSFIRREIAASGSNWLVRLYATPPPGTTFYAVEDQPPSGWVVSEVDSEGVFDAVTGKVKFGPFQDSSARTLSYTVTAPGACAYGYCGNYQITGYGSADGVNSPISGDQTIVVAGRHPADLNPADNYITIGEVTSYGAAWRQGQSWIVPPVPIPIDYVTRAGALWRLGECYTVAGSVTNLPAAWVPCQQGLTQARGTSLASARQIIRHIPLVYAPGNSLAVTLEISPSTSMAVAVEDQVPEGWTVTNVADGGEYDPVNRRVKWGPFLDGAARVLHYQLSPPASIQLCLTMAGVGSFDGISQAVQGDQALVPSGHLEIRPAGDSPAMRLRIFGEPGRVYTVEVSSNLRQWTQLTEVIGADSPIEVFTSISRTEPMRFYRVRLSFIR